MTKTFFRKHNSDWFYGKKAILLRDVRNNGGEVIKKGEIVILGNKYRGFRIREEKFSEKPIGERRSISQVGYECLDLV